MLLTCLMICLLLLLYWLLKNVLNRKNVKSGICPVAGNICVFVVLDSLLGFSRCTCCRLLGVCDSLNLSQSDLLERGNRLSRARVPTLRG